MARWKSFLTDTYGPQALAAPGRSAMKDGDRLYAAELRHHTTTNMTAAEIHALGLSEVARIRGEMEAVRPKLGWKGDLPSLFTHVRTDPKFYFKTEAELLARFAEIEARIWKGMPPLFRDRPQAPFRVAALPALGGHARHRLLQARPARWPHAGHALFQHGDAQYPADPDARDADPPRRHPGPSFPDHAGAREPRPAGAAARWRHHRLFGRLGALFGIAGPRARHVQGPLAVVRPSRHGDAARRAAGGRHRDPCPGLEPRPGDRLHGRQHLDGAARHCRGDRPLYRRARPGLCLQGRRADLPAAAPGRRTATLGDRFDIRDFHAQCLGTGALPLAVLEAKIKAWVARGGGR